MIRRSTLIAVEIMLGLLAALAIGLGVAWWRLSQGPVELGFIREHVQSELSAARSGRPVGIERVELTWSRQGNALELKAVGVTVEDEAGGVLSRADEARIELAVLPLLIGRIALMRAEFIGGEITFTRKPDGGLHVAFGPEGSPPDIIVPASDASESLQVRVARLLDAMEAGFRPVGPGGRLRAVSLRGARLAIIDEGGGGRWNTDAATLELARDGRTLVFVGDARLEGPRGPAPASLRITTDTRFQSAVIEFGAAEVRPRALFSPAALGPFAGLDAPMTATVSVGLDREAGVNRFEGDVALGRGEAEMAGGRFSLDGGSLRGRYDIASDELILDQLTFAGARTRINGEVRVRDASAILRAAPEEAAPFNISLPSMVLDVPGTFAEPISFSNIEAVGAIVSAERSIRLTQLRAQTGQAVLEAAGRLYWAETGREQRLYPGVELTGAIEGALGVGAVMDLWPIGLGEGAREYLARTLTGGEVRDARIAMDIRPADIAAGALRNEAMDIRFNVANASMQFLTTMSPVVAANGSAVLRGNRFDMSVTSARINNLTLTNGRIEAPRLKPRGAMLTIAARAEGDARHLVELLMQEPLDLSDRLPIQAASVGGRGAVALRLQRPMMNDVPFEDWRFTVDGELTNFAGQMTGRRMALSNGRLSVRGDQNAIVVSGPVRAGSSDIQDVRWTEHLNRRGRASSEYQISGVFDADDLVRLGYSVASHARGRLGVTVSGQGRGFDVDRARIDLNLTEASVEAPRGFWRKRAGQAASASFNVDRHSDGGLVFADIDARGAGLFAQGHVRLTPDGRIAEANVPRLVIEGRSNARVQAVRAQDGALDVSVRGALFDGAPFMEADAGAGANAPASAHAFTPMRVNLAVERLKLRGDATLSNARVDLETNRGGLARLVADGVSPGDRPFSLALGPRAADPQGRIRLRAEDAGFAVRALTGMDNIVGGTASADGDWRAGPPNRGVFTVRMRDFQVVRLPAMARLLSSAGSLTGLAEMLNGDGIGFTAFDTEMTYAPDRVTFAEARVAGPSLGLTGAGAYDMARDNLRVDGVVAPSPVLNLSVLGNVPVIGDLLVSRRGEGVFGMTYAINGRAAEPRVSVNPVSALTPGILRRIFEPIQTRQNPPGRAIDAAPIGEGDETVQDDAAAAPAPEGALAAP